MRISEDRYFRDLRPLRLAARMLALEARTRTICIWTGLTRDRVRKLAGSMLRADDRQASVRHRGRSPRQTAYFFRSPRIRTHASVVACHFALVRLLPDDVISARALPSVPRGELLCVAYETYYASFPDILIDFERAILLATALTQRDEVGLARCGDCGGLMIIDLLAKDTEAARLCTACKLHDPDIDISRYLNSAVISEPEQMQLFDGAGGAEPSRFNDSAENARSTDGENKPGDDSH
jgi:Flagellar transcriptional activator (FlhC)